VRNDKLREQEEQRRMRETLRKKEISAKQAAVVIKTIIDEVSKAVHFLCVSILF